MAQATLVYPWRKVVCFVVMIIRSTELGYALDCVFGVFGKLSTRRDAWAWFHGIWTCGTKVLDIEWLIHWKLN